MAEDFLDRVIQQTNEQFVTPRNLFTYGGKEYYVASVDSYGRGILKQIPARMQDSGKSVIVGLFGDGGCIRFYTAPSFDEAIVKIQNDKDMQQFSDVTLTVELLWEGCYKEKQRNYIWLRTKYKPTMPRKRTSSGGTSKGGRRAYDLSTEEGRVAAFTSRIAQYCRKHGIPFDEQDKMIEAAKTYPDTYAQTPLPSVDEWKERVM